MIESTVVPAFFADNNKRQYFPKRNRQNQKPRADDFSHSGDLIQFNDNPQSPDGALKHATPPRPSFASQQAAMRTCRPTKCGRHQAAIDA